MNYIALVLTVIFSCISICGTGLIIDSVIPNYDLYSGGTNISIIIYLGNELNETEIDDVFAFFTDQNNDSIPSTETQKQRIGDRLHVRVLTPQLKSRDIEAKGKVSLLILKGGLEIGKLSDNFYFRPNPSVSGTLTPSFTIISGGIKVTLKGKFMNSSTNPQLIAIGVEENGLQWTSKEFCEPLSSTEVRCSTPKLLLSETAVVGTKNYTSDYSLPINVSQSKKIEFYFSTGSLLHRLDPPSVYFDPIIQSSSTMDYVINHDDKKFYLKGIWPKVFSSLISDVRITIGGKDCSDVRQENVSHISCIPPSMQHHVIKYGLPHATSLPVNAKVGKAEYMLGLLKYKEDEVFPNSIVISMTVLLSIIIVVAIISNIQVTCSSTKHQRSKNALLENTSSDKHETLILQPMVQPERK